MKSKPLAIIIAALLAALIIAYYGTKENTPEETQASETTTEREEARSARTDPRESQVSRPERPSDPQQEEALTQEYSQVFRKLLGDDSVSTDEAAEGLLYLAADPKAPAQVRADALEHALNLTNDENFNQVGEILSSQEAIIPEPLLQTVLDDSYNRKHITQVDTSMRVLRGEYSEEITEEAIELLEFHTDEQHGSDIEAWQQAVEIYRQQNANDVPVEE